MKKLLGILTLTLTLGFLYAQDSTQFMNAYVVIADTSTDYYELRTQMFKLSNKLDFKIDTLGKGFNPDKKILCVSKDSDDKIYAGSYYPRRYPSESLSIEYLDYYMTGGLPEQGSFALVCAITDNKDKAEKIKKNIAQICGNAYILSSSIYMGCMH